MNTRPQESHADLGLIEDDNTPEMRMAPTSTAKHQVEGHSDYLSENRSHHHDNQQF